MSIEMRAVFEKLGFEEDWLAMTDQAPGYRYDLGNLELEAAQVVNRHLVPVFLVSGIREDTRSLSRIRLETPLKVASLEQGIALLAYAVGRSFQPAKPTLWLELGHSWQHLLPWEQERKAYESRPRCKVERDWFRMPAQQLRPLAGSASEEDVATFMFDGQVLTIAAKGARLPMVAQGDAWLESYCVQLSQLSALPKRLTSPSVDIGVWEGRLTINNLSLQVLQAELGAP
ncbi:hypothetical protein [Pseudoroseomonas cervicalis]|uniref:hypothetical protein n=1 Tax=Teichococcus cervicalis TaxID=204525 RepID=UPI00277DCE95|nr:hypothetical protein [Pseudoroseomonas cervicalis]MDQ1081468.1 hypothetical protein [Pseudoroseomonas cervicalis]